VSFNLEARAVQAIRDALTTDPPGLTPHIVAAMRDALQAAEDIARALQLEQGSGEIDVGTPVDAFRAAANAIQRLREGKCR